MFGFFYKNKALFNIFLAFVAFSFILGTAFLWGPGTTNLLGGPFVVKVGNIKITPKEFLLYMSSLQNQKREISKEELKNLTLRTVLINSIFAYLAEKNGFYVSDDEVALAIKNAFKDEKGNFNLKLFENYLKRIGMSPEEYKKFLKKELLAGKYKSAIFTTSYANPEILKTQLLPFILELQAEIYLIPPSFVENNVKLTEDDIKKYYELHKSKFVKREPAKVEIYKFTNKGALKRAYELLKEAKKPNTKPIAVFSENQNATGVYKELLEKTLKSQRPVIKEQNGNYYLTNYIPEREVALPYDKVKSQVEKLLKEQKALEILQKAQDELVKQLLEGKIKLTPQKGNFLAYQLMENFNLNYDQILQILKGKDIFKVLTPKGLVVIKVLAVEENKQKMKSTTKLYERLIRNTDYVRKLNEALQYHYKKGLPIELNQKLLQRF
jgi:hypothetical protein